MARRHQLTEMVAGTVPERQIRALFAASTVTVYQAYPPEIADPALVAGTFVPPFKLGRMTWIKPSFLWMMYRSGWATKPGQERVLGIQITRDGLEWALAHAPPPGTFANGSPAWPTSPRPRTRSATSSRPATWQQPRDCYRPSSPIRCPPASRLR